MYVRLNLGVIQMELGDSERAERAFREAIDAGIATGVRSIALGARVNLGLLRAHVGAFDEALELVRTARAEYETLGDARMTGIALNYEALAHLLRGEPADAERAAARATAALEPLPTTRADALATHARARVALGRADEALELATAAHAVLAEHGTLDDGEMRVRLAWIEALIASGDAPRAREALHEATAILGERARKLGDDGLRASLLARVPENARVMSLARAVG